MHAETEPAFTTGPIEPISGAVPMMPVTNAGNGRRQVTIEECRIGGHTGNPRIPLGRVSIVDALALTAEPANLRARVIVTAPSGQTVVIDMAAVDAHRFRAPYVPTELGQHQVRVEAWVDHPAMWLSQALERVAQDTAGGLTLQRGSAILFGASLRAGHGDREVLALASKMLESADHPALLQTEQVLRAVDLAGRYPDVEMVTVETSWHEVLVQPMHAATGAWCVVAAPTAAAGGIAALGAALERASQLGFDVLCVDLVGVTEGGMTGPDPAQLDAWRELTERARSRGVHVGVRLGLRCGPDHPWRAEAPWWFREHGSTPDVVDGGELDFETQDWGSLWHAVEAVWQAWLDLGVDAFVVHEPQRAPIRFWDWLLPTMRRRQLNLVIGSTGLDDPLVARRLGAGGVDLVFVACEPASWAHPPRPDSVLDDLDREHGAEPSQARVGRWVAGAAMAGVDHDWLRALVFAGLSGSSYAMEVSLAHLLGEHATTFDILVNLHAWRRGAGGPLRPVDSIGSDHLVVLAAEDGPDRAVIVPSGADPTEARALLDRLPWYGHGTGWLDVLAGVVVDTDRLLPDDSLPARLLVPLPPA